MPRHHKCDMAKYRRRRVREKLNKTERQVKNRKIEAAWAKQRRENAERQAEDRRQLHLLHQDLVDVLARRLYQMDPAYAAKKRAMNALKLINSMWKIARSELPAEEMVFIDDLSGGFFK